LPLGAIAAFGPTPADVEGLDLPPADGFPLRPTGQRRSWVSSI